MNTVIKWLGFLVSYPILLIIGVYLHSIIAKFSLQYDPVLMYVIVIITGPLLAATPTAWICYKLAPSPKIGSIISSSVSILAIFALAIYPEATTPLAIVNFIFFGFALYSSIYVLLKPDTFSVNKKAEPTRLSIEQKAIAYRKVADAIMRARDEEEKKNKA